MRGGGPIRAKGHSATALRSGVKGDQCFAMPLVQILESVEHSILSILGTHPSASLRRISSISSLLCPKNLLKLFLEFDQLIFRRVDIRNSRRRVRVARRRHIQIFRWQRRIYSELQRYPVEGIDQDIWKRGGKSCMSFLIEVNNLHN